MKKVDYLIIGGSAAGTTAAEIARSQDADASIVIMSDEPHEEYSRVLLPFYSKKKIKREQVFLKTSQWYEQKGITLLKGVRGQHLDVSKHQLTASDGEIYQYKKLLIAIGGKVIPIAVPGANLAKILYFRTLEDTDRILAAVGASKKAIIVGGGFVSMDFATCFKANGVGDVTIMVREEFYWAGKLGRDSSKIIENILAKNGVAIVTGEEVDHFEPTSSGKAGLRGSSPTSPRGLQGAGGQVGAVVTKSGKRFECDLVGVGIGIKTDLDWLGAAGIKTNRGVLTNEYMETNTPDIWAAGDCAEFHDVVFDRQHIMGNWANATAQGLAAGRAMAGQRTKYETASSYSDTFFDGSYTFIGVTDGSYADEVVARGSSQSGKMTEIYIKTINNVMRIVGATVINNTGEVAPLAAAVKGKVDVSAFADKLADTNFDLKNINP